MKDKKLNIKIIAAKAGVSVATVSRVLNHPDTVAEATKLKVMKIIEEEEYTPNWFARGLNFGKTGTIGIMVPTLLDTACIEMAKGVEDVVHSRDCTTFICNIDNDEDKKEKYIDQLVQKKVDGAILIHSALDEREYEYLKQNKIPVVFIGENVHIENVNRVTIDAEAAAGDVFRFFNGSGLKNVGILCGRTPKTENEAKVKGFRDAALEEGVEIDDSRIIYTDNTIEGGYVGCKKILGMENRPNALFITSDIMAFGAMDALRDEELRVPEDMSLVGFDNIRMSNLVTPKLTTVEKPLHKMGVMGGRLLFDLIEKGEEAFKCEPDEIRLTSRLKVRKSTLNVERINEVF